MFHLLHRDYSCLGFVSRLPHGPSVEAALNGDVMIMSPSEGDSISEQLNSPPSGADVNVTLTDSYGKPRSPINGALLSDS